MQHSMITTGRLKNNDQFPLDSCLYFWRATVAFGGNISIYTNLYGTALVVVANRQPLFKSSLPSRFE